MNEVKIREWIGRRLAEARCNTGLTILQVSQYSGLRVKDIMNWECGNSSPTIRDALRLCRLYGVKLSELMWFLK